jgi:L-cysteate sulfo-lyase
LIATGAVQSNHVRQTAAAAAKLGLKCRLLVDERVAHPSPEYRSSGNVFLDHLLGATIEYFPAGTNMHAAMDAEAERLRAAGARPFIVAGGGSDCAGALGYVWCAQELLAQANESGLRIDWVVHATGSGGTQAGLVTGFEAMRAGIPVLGIAVSRARSVQEDLVFKLARETAEHAGVGDAVARAAVRVDDRYYGPAYGVPTEPMVEAVMLAARLEGLLLDPVYTGKAMAGLIGLAREGFFGKDDNVVFIHTGGMPGLFAYTAAFAAAIGLDAATP